MNARANLHQWLQLSILRDPIIKAFHCESLTRPSLSITKHGSMQPVMERETCWAYPKKFKRKKLCTAFILIVLCTTCEGPVKKLAFVAECFLLAQIHFSQYAKWKSKPRFKSPDPLVLGFQNQNNEGCKWKGRGTPIQCMVDEWVHLFEHIALLAVGVQHLVKGECLVCATVISHPGMGAIIKQTSQQLRNLNSTKERGPLLSQSQSLVERQTKCKNLPSLGFFVEAHSLKKSVEVTGCCCSSP